MQCMHFSTEVPFCIPLLLVGYTSRISGGLPYRKSALRYLLPLPLLLLSSLNRHIFQFLSHLLRQEEEIFTRFLARASRSRKRSCRSPSLDFVQAPNPTSNTGMQNGSSVGICGTHCMHVFCTFGTDLHAQSMFINKISASELSRNFIKSALLVGQDLLNF